MSSRLIHSCNGPQSQTGWLFERWISSESRKKNHQHPSTTRGSGQIITIQTWKQQSLVWWWWWRRWIPLITNHDVLPLLGTAKLGPAALAVQRSSAWPSPELRTVLADNFGETLVLGKPRNHPTMRDLKRDLINSRWCNVGFSLYVRKNITTIKLSLQFTGWNQTKSTQNRGAPLCQET